MNSAARWLLGVVAAAVALALPAVLVEATPLVLRRLAALTMLVPAGAMLWQLKAATPRRAVLSALLGGGLAGALRAALAMGWVTVASPRPLLAGALLCTWAGMLHSCAAVFALTAIRRGSRWLQATSFLAAWVLDALLAMPWQLPAPYMTTTASLGATLSPSLLAGLRGPALSFLAGALGFGLGAALVRRRRPAGLALAAAAAALALVPAPRAVLRDGLLVEVMAFRSGDDFARTGAQALRAPLQADLRLVVLPEGAVFDSPDRDASSPATIELGAARALGRSAPGTGMIAGLHIAGGPGEERYRNTAWVLAPAGGESTRDKRWPVPGGERVPFADVPLVGRLFRLACDVQGELQAGPGAARPAAFGRLRIATAICFEHTLLDPAQAWEVGTTDRVELLVAIGKLVDLGRYASRDLRLSRASRRLHAAWLQAPVVYVTDRGVDVVEPHAHRTLFFSDAEPLVVTLRCGAPLDGADRHVSRLRQFILP